MTSASVLGRAWVYDTGDPADIELWEHEFEPMDPPLRSGAEWARNHLLECYNDERLRELFELPEAGSFQVLFKGTVSGFKCSTVEGDEYDEEFCVDEVKYFPIPEVFMKALREDRDAQDSKP